MNNHILEHLNKPKGNDTEKAVCDCRKRMESKRAVRSNSPITKNT
jgi:hypothetical protein